ncbi:hypothetical protein Daura_20130 [Dactylosporangium aurantiacum]|uniref:Uncharacterized protein n=1 Tax=Dactylosporangium aurantiacum TaxID=35754 RepID=A0A9Q9ISP1_9ACTN|nr:hypothetical protein [Dactylosporangium aurantiacum]MDG6106225.1 hypothetical protein [Dactylosporangium aurantiacum]UWZ58273.1 hypothetical protein Daura_20130 [Dactylosporangium aurantiacum]
MDLDDLSGTTPLQQIAGRVSRQLHDRGILAPSWLVQIIVEQHLTGAHPAAALEMDALDAATAQDLASAIADSVVASVSGPAAAGSPAALDLDDAGRLLMTLGVTTHCALLNAGRLQPALAAVLGRVASCMMMIGSAAQDAHRAGDATLLLPPDTVELAHQAVAGTLAELLAGRWTVVGDEDARTAVLVLLQDGLSRLRTS